MILFSESNELPWTVVLSNILTVDTTAHKFLEIKVTTAATLASVLIMSFSNEFAEHYL